MDSSSLHLLYEAHTLVTRAANATNATSSSTPNRPPVYKAIGLTLAVSSGLLIGSSFVLKKTGLLKANEKYNEEAGEGYGYLKNAYWWAGMTLMIMGELCNFVAYAFVDAILVTPLGALSVVVTTILSAIFLKERLSFVGKVGCFNCIIGSVVIVANAPEQSAVADIQEMKHFVIAPGFLSYAGVIIVACIFIALWVAPRYGKKSMLVYLTICSLIGGLSVVATQGLGSAIVAQAGGKPQFNQWFLYVLLVFVVGTLLTEIIYLNKALNLFNAALVTPTYYVIFTTATIVTSAVLFRGFHGTAISILTVIMGFLQICAGVVLLQLSKSAKDVPDAAVFKGDLDQVREVAEQEQPETEPKADAIRGTAAIIRRISTPRAKMEVEEFRRLHNEKALDQLEPLKENEEVHWDGLRRRKTIIGDPSSTPGTPVMRRKTMHPPLGMSRFPTEEEEAAAAAAAAEERERSQTHPGLLENIRYRASSILHPRSPRYLDRDNLQSPMYPVALTDIQVHTSKSDSPRMPYTSGDDGMEEDVLGLPSELRKSSRGAKPVPSPRSKPLPNRPEQSPLPPFAAAEANARRQFSFSNFLGRRTGTPVDGGDELTVPASRSGLGSRSGSYTSEQKKALKNASEEERLGLVKGDSHRALLESSPERAHPLEPIPSHSRSDSGSSDGDTGDDYYGSYAERARAPSQPHPRGRRDVYYPRSRSSDSDGDHDWQMTTPPMTDLTTMTTTTNLPTTNIRNPPSNPAQASQQQQQQRPSSRRRPSPPRDYQSQVVPQFAVVSPGNRTGPTLVEINSSRMRQRSHSRTASSPQTGAARPGRPAQPALTVSNHFQSSSTSQTATPAHIRLVSQDRGRDRDRRPEASVERDDFRGEMRREESPEEMDETDLNVTASSKKRYELQSAREREERRKRMSSGFINNNAGSSSQGGAPGGFI